MQRLRPLLATNGSIVAGVTDPDDCAIVASPGDDKVLLQSVDFFRAFWPDPFVFGQIAATHSLSDIFAKGADATTALAICVLPAAAEDVLEEHLFQVMAGAAQVLNASGCVLVGGHTGEGPEMSLGFAVNGVAPRNSVMRKGGMAVGNVLILTKSLGTGVVLAAEMRGKAKASWVAATLASMLESNQQVYSQSPLPSSSPPSLPPSSLHVLPTHSPGWAHFPPARCDSLHRCDRFWPCGASR
jgi:selenide,water dikinase